MPQYIVKHDGSQDLEFFGRLLADVSNQGDGSRKWTEIRIYSTNKERYVLTRARISLLPGEKTIHEAAVVESPDDVLSFLRDVTGRLGPLSKAALEAAGTMDPQIQVRVDADSGELVRCFLEYSDGDFVQEIMREPLPEEIFRKVLSFRPVMSNIEPGQAPPAIVVTGDPYREAHLVLQRPSQGKGFARYVEARPAPITEEVD